MTASLAACTPRLEIQLDKIYQNTTLIVKKTGVLGVKTVGITKGCAGDPDIARTLAAAGVAAIGDAHYQNLERLKNAGINLPFWLIRSPLWGQIPQVVENTAVSLNSAPSTIERLAIQRQEIGSNHQAVLMLEAGDRREGLVPETLAALLGQMNAASRETVTGIGATFGCLTHLSPVQAQLNVVAGAARIFEKCLGRPPQIITLGGSSLLPPMLANPQLLRGVTHLRVGEAFLLGTDGLGNTIEGLWQDAIELVAEVVEVHERPKFTAAGREVLVGVGYQDLETADSVVTSPPGAAIAAATSDHLVLACQAQTEARVGQEVRIRPSYRAMLRAFLSPYVEKCKKG
jgi:ornithine racemase